MKQSFFFGHFVCAGLVGVALATSVGVSHSQQIAPQPPTTQGQTLLNLCSDGFFEEAIARATDWIDKPVGGRVAPIVYYWRGRAEFRIGQYDQAQSDLNKAADLGLGAQGALNAAQTLDKIKALKACLPPQTEDIKDPENDKVTLFHVYYTTKNALTQNIIAALPLAYRIDTKMYKRTAANETAVIFDTTEQMAAFKKLRGQKMTNWASAYADATGIYFCLQTPQGKPLERTAEDLQATATHEFNHALLRRMMGPVKNPTWFVEGIAVYAQSKVQGNAVRLNDQRIKCIAEANLLLPPERFETHENFVDITEESVDNRRNGKGQVQPSGYAQGFNMTRYLLTKIPENQLPTFMQSIRDKKSFEPALQANLGLTLPQFYEQWRKDTLARLGVQDTPQNAAGVATPGGVAPQNGAAQGSLIPAH